MQGEKESYERATPQSSGHPLQRGEQEQTAQRVKQHIGQVMPSAAQPEELTIRHLRKPCQRKPILGVRGSERPNHTFPRQSRAHVVVFGDVLRVVKVDEIEMPNRAVHCQSGEEQQQINAQHARSWLFSVTYSGSSKLTKSK